MVKIVEAPIIDCAGNPTGLTYEIELSDEEFKLREAMLPPMKVCKKCKVNYPTFDYGKDKRQSDGLNRYCKPCHRGNCAKARKKRCKPCVYQLFFTDGSTYIGSTIQNFNDRLAVHRAKVAKKIHTNKLFNNFEPEDITGKVLLYLDSEDELRRNEYVMIKHYKNVYGAHCLNSYMYTGAKVENKGQENENQSEVAAG